jgi:hypothetical protein
MLSPKGDAISEDIYAKLVSFDELTCTWLIHFTTLPPALLTQSTATENLP